MKIKSKSFLLFSLGILSVIVLTVCSCSKDLSFERSHYFKDFGNWTFMEGANTYTGKFDKGYYFPNDLNSELRMTGHSNDNPEDSIRLSIFTDTVRVGTYRSSDFTASFDYGSHSPFKYSSSQLQGDFSITITSLVDSVMEGNFEGTVLDIDGDLVSIDNGTFQVDLK